MTPEDAARNAAESYARTATTLTEELRTTLGPALARLNRELSALNAALETEEERRRHPRITQNLHKLHRRYRRPT